MSHSSWRSWCVPVAGVLILAGSFGPWWVLKLAAGGRLADDYGSHLGAVSAWQASGRWALAVGLALAVAVVWTGWCLFSGGAPDWLRGLLILISVAPIVLVVHQWQSIPPPPPLPSLPQAAEFSLTAEIRPGDEFTDPGLDPHQLYRGGRSSLSKQGPGWGLYVGTAGLVLLTAGLLINPGRTSLSSRH
jgi:hypothetical protein